MSEEFSLVAFAVRPLSSGVCPFCMGVELQASQALQDYMDKILQREGFSWQGPVGRREGNAVKQFTKNRRPGMAQILSSSRPLP